MVLAVPFICYFYFISLSLVGVGAFDDPFMQKWLYFCSALFVMSAGMQNKEAKRDQLRVIQRWIKTHRHAPIKREKA